MPLLAGVGCGVLSAWGIGGGTLLLLVMTLAFGVDQAAAQGINLLYFLPTAAMGLIWHRQNGLLDKVVLPAHRPLGAGHGRRRGLGRHGPGRDPAAPSLRPVSAGGGGADPAAEIEPPVSAEFRGAGPV